MSQTLECAFNPFLASGLNLYPLQKSDFSRGLRKIRVKESVYKEIVGLNLLKEGLHLSCFLMNFTNFFRQAILQHTSERPHLEDFLALSETAEPK